MSKSREVISPQGEVIHKDLEKVVRKHLEHPFQRPIQDHTKRSYDRIKNQLKQMGERPIILDSACGVGMSSFKLAVQNPDAIIIGIDKSQDRIVKSDWYKVNVERSSGVSPENVIIERADVIDFWRIALDDHLKVEKHYILYPNPWPKQDGFTKRWQGHAIFPVLCDLCDTLELRSNWKLYLEEFKAAHELVKNSHGNIYKVDPCGDYLTAFEKKYAESGQELWQLNIYP